jgi:hypothetical protein
VVVVVWGVMRCCCVAFLSGGGRSWCLVLVLTRPCPYGVNCQKIKNKNKMCNLRHGRAGGLPGPTAGGGRGAGGQWGGGGEAARVIVVRGARRLAVA